MQFSSSVINQKLNKHYILESLKSQNYLRIVLPIHVTKRVFNLRKFCTLLQI